ncbi:23S rRNA (adenine(2503)-C(2))-methyltransferase RlmN [Sedimentibacter sp. zth1]|uniref:23S rRNA (adenine(2503)-C(2))-methyltransferase RlmN n=1 Tax=Sedimentibacter sp. zth1 TaxID=2816908 RepID=UPI001A92F34E|nr:23S rRNA (adenine(2503)-C(2))-methyltransferase RlmN [Sedimentibacter sp. zth1]QSX06859.1 23S rRNA (adenine(2503)-C(2))-methyltransferase RlmN [Sedimentibacter sp. zth1]
MIKVDNLILDKLQEKIIELKEPAFRAKQIYEWVHKKNVTSFDEMKNISNKSKELYKEHFQFTKINILERYDSKLDETKKYLMVLEDENIIETVFLKYKYGNTLCISSQVGCKMGCVFCASTKKGFIRNLNVSEMLNQIYLVQKDTGERISNIVIMGTGEPLENYNNILDFFKIINDEMGQNISLRKITMSTCGVVPKIYELADLDLQITLAISLHVANQEKREQVLPIARKYNLSELKDACNYYIKKTNKRITFEYILIDGFNDNYQDAMNLCNYLDGMLCNINLIPYNSIKESDISSSTESNINKFKQIITQNGLTATVRRELGSDINAACGQLRNNFLTK